jgi:hypothetical protein
MKFYEWLINEVAQSMTPWEAMVALELTNLAGEILDSSALRSKFRELSLKHHPDRNVGDENANATMIKINNANSVLQDYIGRTLPSGESQSSSREQPRWGTTYGTGKQKRPEDAKNVTEDDVKKWCEEAVALGRIQVYVREPHMYFGLWTSLGNGPLGIKGKTKRLDKTITPDQLFDIITYMVPNFPTSLVDIGNTKWESYLTYMDEGQRPTAAIKLRSICLEVPKVAKKKEAGVGMSRQQIIDYLESKNLKLIRYNKEGEYYGFQGQPEDEGTNFIRIKTKKMDGILVAYDDYSYRRVRKDIIITKEIYFGEVTPKILDAFIIWLKKRLKEKFGFVPRETT